MTNFAPFDRVHGRLADDALEDMAHVAIYGALKIEGMEKHAEISQMFDAAFWMMKDYDFFRHRLFNLPTETQATDYLSDLFQTAKKLRKLLGMEAGDLNTPISEMPYWLAEMMLPQAIFQIDDELEVGSRIGDYITYAGMDEDAAHDAHLLTILSQSLQGVPILERTLEIAIKLNENTEYKYSRPAPKGRTSKKYLVETIRRYCGQILEAKLGVKIVDNTDAAGEPIGPVYEHLECFFGELDPELASNPQQIRYYFRQAMAQKRLLESYEKKGNPEPVSSTDSE